VIPKIIKWGLHQSNLEQFRSLKLLDEIPFKKCIFLHFFSNECIIIFSFKKKTTTISKKRRFYKWALHYFFDFLLFGYFFESQIGGPMAIEKL
jgi:hypothetical protein